MTMPVVFKWPLLDPEAICLTQTNNLGGGPLIINGNLSSPIVSGYVGNSPSGFVAFPNIYRVVRITSTDTDNTGAFVTINGILNGVNVSEIIECADIGFYVETTQLFGTITSVTTDQQVINLQVGSGSTGQTAWYLYDYNRKFSTSLLQVTVQGVIDYSVLETLDDISSNPNPHLYDVTGDLTAQTTNAFGATDLTPFRYASCFVNASDDNGGLVFTILQTGIT